MKKLLVMLLLVASTAQAITLTDGSWGYEEPFVPPPANETLPRPLDGQPLTLTGTRFKFVGTIYDFWMGTEYCATPTSNGVVKGECTLGTPWANWYSGLLGLGYGPRGYVTLGGSSYKYSVGYNNTNRLELGIYKINWTNPPLPAPEGTMVTRVVTAKINSNSRLKLGSTYYPITGLVAVTLELCVEDGKWVVEGLDFDIIGG